jgi:hypothetical protein
VGTRDFVFSTPTQPEPGPQSLPYNTYWGSFQGVRWPGHGVEQPLPSSAKVRHGYSYISTSPLCPQRHVMGPLPTLTQSKTTHNKLKIVILCCSENLSFKTLKLINFSSQCNNNVLSLSHLNANIKNT